MSMQTRAGDYLAMRRSLGFKLHGEGRMLADFAARLDDAGQASITISAALAWATESQEAAPAHWRRRLSVVRGFARYLATLDPACQIPPADLLAAPSHRPPPYIYSAEEIAALIHAAGTIGAPVPSATLQALISLIAATGLRVGEAIRPRPRRHQLARRRAGDPGVEVRQDPHGARPELRPSTCSAVTPAFAGAGSSRRPPRRASSSLRAGTRLISALRRAGVPAAARPRRSRGEAPTAPATHPRPTATPSRSRP